MFFTGLLPLACSACSLIEPKTTSPEMVPPTKGLYPLFMYINALSACMSAYTHGCEPPCGCWELNSGPLEEQSVLLTTEPSLQPPEMIFSEKIFVSSTALKRPHDHGNSYKGRYLTVAGLQFRGVGRYPHSAEH